MDKQYTLKVDRQDVAILQQSLEKIQIMGKDSIIVANIYQKVLDIAGKIIQDDDKASSVG